jgi:hypothetical protein
MYYLIVYLYKLSTSTFRSIVLYSIQIYFLLSNNSCVHRSNVREFYMLYNSFLLGLMQCKQSVVVDFSA